MDSQVPTVEELSNDFLTSQALSSDDGIKVKITNSCIFPSEQEWILRLRLGEPFDEGFIRIRFDNRYEAFVDVQNEIVEEFITDLSELSSVTAVARRKPTPSGVG